jgi:hypothetical protein
VYWTIKKGHESGKNSNLSACWKMLSKEMMEKFQNLRAERYCGGKLYENDLKNTNMFYDQIRTIAAQGGLALLFGSIARKAGATSAKDRSTLAKRIGKSISEALTGTCAKKIRYCLVPKMDGSLNLIGKLQPRFAGHWRYLWLEVMTKGSGMEGLATCGLGADALQELVDQARTYYIHEMVIIRMKDLQRLQPTRKLETFREKAEQLVTIDLTEAFTKSLGFKKPEAGRIWKQALKRKPGTGDASLDEDEDLDNGDEDGGLI